MEPDNVYDGRELTDKIDLYLIGHPNSLTPFTPEALNKPHKYLLNGEVFEGIMGPVFTYEIGKAKVSLMNDSDCREVDAEVRVSFGNVLVHLRDVQSIDSVLD